MTETEKALTTHVTDLRGALQWLLDDMADAGEAFSPEGVLYDSVEHAAKALKACGGSPPYEINAALEKGMYKTLIDVHAAILKGELDPTELAGLTVDNEFVVDVPGRGRLFACSTEQAAEFITDILGITYEVL